MATQRSTKVKNLLSFVVAGTGALTLMYLSRRVLLAAAKSTARKIAFGFANFIAEPDSQND